MTKYKNNFACHAVPKIQLEKFFTFIYKKIKF